MPMNSKFSGEFQFVCFLYSFILVNNGQLDRCRDMLFSINFNFVDVGLIRKFSTIACEQLNIKRRIFSTKCMGLVKTNSRI